MISFSCEFCERKYRVDDNLAGRRVKCKECGTELAIPGGMTKTAAAKRSGPDLYGLDDEDEAAPMPPPRRAGVESPPLKRKAAIHEGDGENKMLHFGAGMLVLGIIMVVLPMFGLVLAKRGHGMDPVAQTYGGFFTAGVGIVFLMIAFLTDLDSSEGTGKRVYRCGWGLIVASAVVCTLVGVSRKNNANAPLANDSGPNFPNAPPPNFPNAPGPNFGAVPGMPPGANNAAKVVVSGGRAMVGRGPAGIGTMGVNFEIDYRVESRGFGPPMYDLVVKTANSTIRLVPPVRLDDSGTLNITVPAATQADGPFAVHFETSSMGGRGGTRVSDPVALSWVNAPPPGTNAFQPPGNPFGNPPNGVPGQPGFRPPGMPPNIPMGPRGPRGLGPR